MSTLDYTVWQTRTNKGMSLREVAKQTRIHASTINRIENGIIRNPTERTKTRLAKWLGRSVDSINKMIG